MPVRQPRGRKDRTPVVVAIILAAGASVRMGGPKLLVPVAGEPLLARTLGAVRRARLAQAVVVLGADADRVQKSVPMDDMTVVVNPRYEEGMSSSIRAGLRRARPAADAYLIVLGDEPFVLAETMALLVAAWRPDGPLAVIPTFLGRRGHPVLIDRRIAPRIQDVSGDTGYRALFGADEVLEVPVDDPGILLDLDDRRDLEELSRGLESGRPLAQVITDLVLRRDRLG